MAETYSRWVGAGLLAAGLCSAMLLGVGIAAAEPAGGSASGGAGSSQSAGSASGAGSTTDPDPAQSNSTKPDTKLDPKPDRQPGAEDDGTDDDATEQDATEPDSPSPESASPTAGGDAEVIEETIPDPDANLEPDLPDSPRKDDDYARTPISGAEAVPNATPVVDIARTEETARPVETVDAESAAVETEAVETEAVETAAVDTAAGGALITSAKAAVGVVDAGLRAATVAALIDAEQPAAPPAQPTLVNVLGTLAWSVFDFVTAILEGPPVVPVGSSVSVGRSKLEIDCGDGYTADADWYYPTTGTPDKLIYFQHGFLARAGFYNLTAAELAERNNAIVVAPSITSNYFACDACNLASDPMHAAVAELFMGDRAELLASARAAGYEGTLPEQFVLAGHSAGGQLAPGAAGFYYQLAPAAEKDDLVGVLIYDTSGSGGGLARSLDKLPMTLPVLHIAANPSFFDTFGNANPVLEQKRPGQFNGVLLVDGSHSDAFRSSGLFGFTQLAVSIGTGFSLPENVDAVQVLSQGWLTDMYAGTVYDPTLRTGIYGGPNEIVDVPTETGTDARAYVLPVPPPNLNVFESLIVTLFDSVDLTTLFAGCAEDPNALIAASALEPARHSTFETALSLDVTSRKGQSVGQQCVN